MNATVSVLAVSSTGVSTIVCFSRIVGVRAPGHTEACVYLSIITEDLNVKLNHGEIVTLALVQLASNLHRTGWLASTSGLRVGARAIHTLCTLWIADDGRRHCLRRLCLGWKILNCPGPFPPLAQTN